MVNTKELSSNHWLKDIVQFMWQPNFITTAKFRSKTPKFRKQQKSAHVFMENNTRQTQKNRTPIID